MMKHLPVGQRRRVGENLFAEVTWRRWERDPRAFISECVYIRVVDGSGVGGKKLFVPYDYQDAFLEDILSNKFVLGLKARQLGFTTMTSAYALWLLLFKPGGANILMMSKSQDDANKNLGMIDQMYRLLPDWVKVRGPRSEGVAKTEKAWRHRDGTLSRIRSLPPTTTTGAGETADLVILDEFDLYENANPADVWNVIEPTTMGAASNVQWKQAVCIIISTPRTPDGVFARMYRAGKSGAGRFKTLFVPCMANRFLWTDGAFDKLKYEAIAEEKRQLGEPWKIFSEYPRTDEEAFKKSGASRFSDLPEFDECVEPLDRGELRERDGVVEFIPSPGGKMRVFEWPQRDRFYVLSVDPAHGVGKDYTVGQVFAYDDNGDPYVAAAWWSNTTEQHEAAPELFWMGRFFKGFQSEAMLVFDNGGGHSELMVHVWRSLGYQNFYSYISKSARKSRALRYGMTTSGPGGARSAVIDGLAAAVPVLGNMYLELREELGTFVVKDNGRPEADFGCHDDHVMSCAMGLWVLQLKHIGAPVGPVGRSEPSHEGTLTGLYEDIDRELSRKRAADSAATGRWVAARRRAKVRARRR